jgi:hypothetical protein
LGRLVIKEGDSLSDPLSLRFFIVTHAAFSSVGAEMLSGGSVVAGWDQKERAGPKDGRQVIVGSKRWSKINTESNNM